jgi:uncharacterized membrane protein YebE (DUF533 family)
LFPKKTTLDQLVIRTKKLETNHDQLMIRAMKLVAAIDVIIDKEEEQKIKNKNVDEPIEDKQDNIDLINRELGLSQSHRKTCVLHCFNLINY